ncbi:[protein-PII] uridylyltransferase [Desulfobacterales bacterium HSG16]|nr:[protein-PII] uridylyltransferase [Desulfobacterales bacterium HSG16]
MNTTCKIISERLKANREDLIKDFYSGATAKFVQNHTYLVDEYFRKCFAVTGTKICSGFALLALGGYGRAEQCIHSDVDLLLLFDKEIPDIVGNLISEMVYPLWDVGIQVAYSTRTIDETLEIARENVEELTTLLDARLLGGQRPVFSGFMRRFRKELVKEYSNTFVESIINNNICRHDKFGDSSYLLEPNLKEGKGGLRDYHTMLWITKIRYGLRRPRDLEYFGCFSHDEYIQLQEALKFIWLVRNYLHDLSGRKNDQLYFKYQEKIADLLDYREKNGQQPVEQFLGRLHTKMNFIKEKQRMLVYDFIYAAAPVITGTTPVDGLEIHRRALELHPSEKIINNPMLLIKIFEQSASMGLPLSASSKRLIRDFLYLVDDEFKTSKEAVISFEGVLIHPASPFMVLNTMLETGFLTRFVPQFAKIKDRIQYDDYHIYPVDKHSIYTVQTIKKIGTPEDEINDPCCTGLYRDLSEKKLLLWAALLHDIGKGDSERGKHAEKGVKYVQEVMSEKGYGREDINKVSFLVKEHLFLIQVATRRDVQDEETAIFCASKIKYVERLNMLYLLTIADSVSTGPKAWNDWTSYLLRSLYVNILNILENGELAGSRAVDIMEEKRESIRNAVAGTENEKKIEPLLLSMSPRYLMNIETEEVIAHINLFKKLGKSGFVWEWQEMAEADKRIMTICIKDVPGLVSKIAGVFTLHGIDVEDVKVYTWFNRVALDIFTVKPPPDKFCEMETWDKANWDLDAALSGKLDLSAALKQRIDVYGSGDSQITNRPHNVHIDNVTSRFFTIIEVFTYDFPGLLFKVTDAIFQCGLDVRFAKIATKVEQVVDVFYVRDIEGEKVEDEKRVEKIREAIIKVLPIWME